jgi:DNA ligase (NAD+)
MEFKENPNTEFKELKKLTQEEARDEVEALREGIEYHDFLYYVKNQPKISDAVYDKLFHRLQELERTFPELRSDTSPTQRVGAELLDELKKVDHAAAMLSLNSALEEKDVKNFHDFIHRHSEEKSVKYVLEPKFDGLSVEVVYEKGCFRYGSTRGNGEVGEDISENLKTIKTLPLHLQKTTGIPDFLSVRGEVFMDKNGFQQLNKERIEKGLEPYANPRNSAAGTMRQLDPKKVAGRPLDLYFYEILKAEDSEKFSSHWKVLRQFSKWGLKTDPHSRKATSLKDIKAYHQHLSDQRETLDYEIDGIVIKVDNYELRLKLGVRQRSPRWAYAWKFSPKEEVTILEDIVVQVGRTGMLTPVALLEPVDVGGVTVSRATLHNEDEVKKKDVRPGDKVRIVRAGDVIPEVLERVGRKKKKRKEPFSMPKKCPACGADIYREKTYYFCPAGLSCAPQVIGRIIHYGSRNAMDVKGLGEKTAKDMVEKGLVKGIMDLYKLKVEDFLELEGFAQKSAEQLHRAIQEAKKPRLDRFLYALGIRHVGQRIARVLANKYRSLDALREATLSELKNTEEIGPEIARSVTQFFTEKTNRQILKGLEQEGVKIKPMPEKQKTFPCQGNTFVFTGKLKKYTREDAKRRVENLGGRTSSSVSGETDYVVAGENPGSKLEDAQRHRIRILNEEEFKELTKG